MEAIFDAAYLIFDLIAGILFFSFAKGNTLFILYGILTLTLCGGDAFLYAISGNTGNYNMTRMIVAIIISFGCYIPVTLFSKTKSKVGLLMIPKTCAYMWMIVIGLQLMF